jgi:phage gpG-like protein
LAGVQIKDYSADVKSLYEQARERSLEIIGLKAEEYAKGETVVKTGRLRNSITHAVSGESKTFTYADENGKSFTGGLNAPSDGDDAVYVGTNVEYAPVIEARDHFLLRAATAHPNTYKKIIEDEFAKIK